MSFDARYECDEPDGMNMVSTPDTRLFIWAIISSDSKSETTRRPLTMKSAPTSRARSTTRLENMVIRTLSRCDVASAIRSWRSSSVNSGSPFCGLRTAATTTSSNSRDATSMISMCPLWIGSNDPG